jgi:hypothetical protein
MSTIHFIGGEKGGVGKSVVARVLAQYFIDHSIAFRGIDADRSNATLRRYYADYAEAADLEDFGSADQIMDGALGADRRVLVDLPAQGGRALRRWLEASDVLGLAEEMSLQLIFWHVTDGGFDSVNLLGELVELTQGNANRRAIVVRNRGRSSSFSQFDESSQRQRLLDTGGLCVDLPALDAATMYAIDRHGASLWAAIHAPVAERALSPMERRRAKHWLAQAYAALEPLRDIL